MCLLKHHKKQMGMFYDLVVGWGPLSSSCLPGENLLKPTVLKGFREHHNSDSLRSSYNQRSDGSSGQHTIAGTALGASAPHLTLTHYWM